MSAAEACVRLNSGIEVVAYTARLSPGNALRLFRQYDVIVDGTDNQESRYLISDAAVLAGRPLVSGAAVGTNGQLTVYHHRECGEDGRHRGHRRRGGSGEEGEEEEEEGVGEDEDEATFNEIGPCYRCLFPTPSSAGGGSCSDSGVLGMLPGCIGVLQALEAVKVAAGLCEVEAERQQQRRLALALASSSSSSSSSVATEAAAAAAATATTAGDTAAAAGARKRPRRRSPPASYGGVLSRRLLILDGMDMRASVVKLRSRRMSCAACGLRAHGGGTVRSLEKDTVSFLASHGLNSYAIARVDREQREAAAKLATGSDSVRRGSCPFVRHNWERATIASHLPESARIGVLEYAALKPAHVLVDVRGPAHCEWSGRLRRH